MQIFCCKTLETAEYENDFKIIFKNEEKQNYDPENPLETAEY